MVPSPTEIGDMAPDPTEVPEIFDGHFLAPDDDAGGADAGARKGAGPSLGELHRPQGFQMPATTHILIRSVLRCPA